MESFDGILLIDKPGSFTSFDVIAKLRGMARTRRAGHAGTLDPMATGVLPVSFGRAAKAIDLLPNHDKTYEASFKLGLVTDTCDTTGTTLATGDFSGITAAMVEDALKSFTGFQEQTPPMYSAVRVGGRRLYDIARSGGEIERKPRGITVYDIALLNADEKSGVYGISITCSRGTYIRALCNDLGEKLGCGAAMSALRRTMACGFSIDRCITLEEAQSLADAGRLRENLLPVDTAFSHLERFFLSPEQTVRFQNGLELRLSQFAEIPESGATLAVYGGNGRFLGLASVDADGDRLKIIKLFSLGENL